ncbi:unnamed protein product [Trichogramma brassicae]|uniref:Uncharacterized protein n=1 Tax=Trichogramma brassicae TaxID=86971 RepID=A0A6H5IXT1_9HYME|nr:unnamed protein product [Trichogramma brassicae]
MDEYIDLKHMELVPDSQLPRKSFLFATSRSLQSRKPGQDSYRVQCFAEGVEPSLSQRLAVAGTETTKRYNSSYIALETIQTTPTGNVYSGARTVRRLSEIIERLPLLMERRLLRFCLCECFSSSRPTSESGTLRPHVCWIIVSTLMTCSAERTTSLKQSSGEIN